jgi:energy-coupling factor transporter ATP-binding protein EcfA2
MQAGDVTDPSERGAVRPPEVLRASGSPAFRLLEVRSVSKRFGSLRALDNVSFGIRRGEVLGLIGPNGAGKTTLFECLAGVLPADTGDALWNGRPVSPAERKDVLFFLPDQIAPWADQPAGRVLSLFARLFEADPSRLSRLVNALGLSRFLYAEASGAAGGPAALAQGLSPPPPSPARSASGPRPTASASSPTTSSRLRLLRCGKGVSLQNKENI